LIDPIVLAAVDHAKAANVLGGELALVYGSFSVQSEYISTMVATTPESTLQNEKYYFSAFYGYASFFITGEHRNYKTSLAAFDRVKPNKNFGKDKGAGAWELGLRYSDIDLEDTDIRGGELANISLGVNWYLNPATRFMFNYVLANLKGAGNFNVFEMRFQVDF